MPKRIESFRCRWDGERASYHTDIIEDVERLLVDLAGLTYRNPADVDPAELQRLNDRINELAGVLNATESRNAGKLDLSVISGKKGRKRRPGRETKFNANDDARLAAEWTKARNRGAYKRHWARANGMSVKELDQLLARNRFRKSARSNSAQ